MQTTVLIENASVLIAVGAALHKTHKAVLLAIMIAILAHMAFDNALLANCNPAQSIEGNVKYYFSTSLFFLAMFGLFIAKGVKSSKLSVIMAGCMIAQAILSFFVALNGAVISGVYFPEFDFIYWMHESFNKAIWIVECIVVYVAAYTESK